MKTKPITVEKKPSFSSKKIFIPLFFIFLMIFSAFAIIFSSPPSSPPPSANSREYQGVLFTREGASWTGSLQGRTLTLRYHPSDLALLFPTLDFTPLYTLFKAQKIYLSRNPDGSADLPLQELYANLKPYYPSLLLSCTTDGPGCEEFPLKTCRDATDQAPVLILQEESLESPVLDYSPSCAILRGNERDLLQVSDKIILSLAGL